MYKISDKQAAFLTSYYINNQINEARRVQLSKNRYQISKMQ